MSWYQKTIKLEPRRRGFHLVTADILAQVPEIAIYQVGILQVFLQHTSASLTINENADPDVPLDLETALSRVAPEDADYLHTCEGSDDMPAHIKSSLLGSSLTIPIQRGQLQLGTWQGIYLCEHRNRAGSRKLVITICGEMSQGS